MDIIITNGRLTLKPVPGEEEGTRVGYLLEIQDIETQIKVVSHLPYARVRELAEIILADMEQHPEGHGMGVADAGGPDIEVADASVLRRLPGLRKA